jgi:predicted nucleic acid-binding protein
MAVTVVDASAVAAVLFDEPEAEPILSSIAGSLIAPSLIVYELASVCATKMMRRPADSETLLSRYALFADLDITLREPDWHALPQLAIEQRLSAYDAAYLQLAIAERARLVTLDARLARAFDTWAA